MNPADQLTLLTLELRLTRQNFARLLDECADVVDGKIKKTAHFGEHLRKLAEMQRTIARTLNQ